jgi:hypothetical protein
MVTHSLEQTTHDRLNLARLVRRLEKSTQNGKWNENGEVRYDSWIQAQGMLQVRDRCVDTMDTIGSDNIRRQQKVKYAKRLLKDVTLQDSETSMWVISVSATDSPPEQFCTFQENRYNTISAFKPAYNK